MSGAPNGVLAIVGATATGKSALAVALAERLGGEVISADAFAIYRGLDAGTAKPTVAERRGIPHRFLDEKEPTEGWSAGEFGREARRAAREALSRGRLPILCGGTGFYVRSFFEGLFEGPRRDAGVRDALGAVHRRRGPGFLARAVALLDPPSAVHVGPNDAVRATRLLEIALATGRRPSELFRERPGERWDGPAVKLLLSLPRPGLYGRIEERFRTVMRSQLPSEVERLLAAGVPPHAPALAAIGYRDTVELVRGRIGPDEWERRVVSATRRFAKRQETWFRAERGLVELRADRPDLVDAAAAAASSLFFPSEGGHS